MQQPVFNLLASPPDPRDYLYWPDMKIEDCPRSLDNRHLVTRVEDQLNAGACGGNGGTSLFEALAKAHGVSMNLSRLFSYVTAKKIGNRLSQDGVFMRDIFRAGYHFGVPLEDGPNGYPYDVEQQYVDPPEWAYAEAAKMKVERYEAIVSTANNMLGHFTGPQVIERLILAMNEGFMPAIGMQVTASLSTLTGPWRTHQYKVVGPGYPSIGGHWMDLVGYDMDYRMFLALNSWGAHRGDGGYVGLPFEIVNDWVFESWIARSFNGWKVPDAPTICLAGINRLNLHARIVPEEHEIGKTVNVWFGAKRAPDGPIYLRHGMNDWRLMENDAYPPAITGIQLQENNVLDVVSNMDISNRAGLDIYVAYGETPVDWKLRKICTIPQF